MLFPMGSLKFSMSEQLTAVWFDMVRDCTKTVAHELYSIRILLKVIPCDYVKLALPLNLMVNSKVLQVFIYLTIITLNNKTLLMIITCCFISFSQYTESWNRIREWGYRCPYYINTWNTEESAYISVRSGRFYEGPFRCVSNAENVTAPDNSSEVLNIKVHCECLG